jgi:Type VI secretion system/phage-baseplate injector OB domain
MDDSKLFHGVYRGIVADNADPDGHRRVKVQIPQLTEANISNWCWPKETSSLKTQVPNKGEGVWVMFEGGDPNFPVWVGTFGKQTSGKRINVKVLSDSVSLSAISSYVITERTKSGTTEVDLVATIIAMANKIANHETRIAALESNLTSLHATLATKTSTGHTHSTAG